MAKYKQIRRNGRWITVDENGKEVGVGQGYLRDVARSIRDIGVYSDKTDSKGNPLTISQAKSQSNKPRPNSEPKPTPKPKPTVETKPKPKPKPAPAEVKPTTPTVRASEQRTTTTRPPAKPARTEPKPQAKQSKNMDDNYAAWVKANRSLAEKVKPGQAGYDAIQKALGKSSGSNDSMKIDKSTSKNGSSTSPSSSATYSPEEMKRGNAGFSQDSVSKIKAKETEAERRRREQRERNRNIA